MTLATLSLDTDTLKKLSPPWWGAIAGAVAAGATLAPNHRILGGALGGLAMFYIAKKLTGPCCAECAGASSSAATPDSPPSLRTDARAMVSGIPASDCASCGIDDYS